jgi:hypothetical protein
MGRPRKNPITEMIPVMGEPGTLTPAPETTETLLSETTLETNPDMPESIAALTVRNVHPLCPELEII